MQTMKEIDKTIKVKTDWSEITILEYIQINDIVTSDMDELEKISGLVGIITGMDYKDVMSLDVRILKKITDLMPYLYQLPSTKLKSHYVINGVNYTVHYDMSKVNTSQYIDLIALSTQNDILHNIHKIVSLFLIPARMKRTIFGKRYIQEKYGSYDVKEAADIFLNNLSIDVAYSMMVFFCKNFDNLTKATQHYLDKTINKLLKMKEIPKDLKVKINHMRKSGDGLGQLMMYQQELEEAGRKSGK